VVPAFGDEHPPRPGGNGDEIERGNETLGDLLQSHGRLLLGRRSGRSAGGKESTEGEQDEFTGTKVDPFHAVDSRWICPEHKG
jgi:hypothetical protein